MVAAGLRRMSLPLVIAALIVVAGLSLNRVYDGRLLVALVAGAALASVLVSAGLRRAPGWLVAAVSVLLLAAYGLFTVRVSAQAGGLTGDLRSLGLDAAANAVPRLLTALIPVEPQPDTVLAPVVLAWLAGFAGAELAARARRPALALVPPTLLYAGALVLVGPNASVLGWQPVAFAGLAALGLTAGGGTLPRRTALRGLPAPQRFSLWLHTAAGLAIALVVVLGLAAVSAPVVVRRVARTPGDPRALVAPPSLDVLDENPLIRISGWAADPKQRLFQVTILRGARPSATVAPTPTPSVEEGDGPDATGAGYDTRLRLAVLAEWDGVTWHCQANYRSAGRVLPPVAPPPGGAGDSAGPPLDIQERITVDQLDGRLLPAVAAPRRVDGVRVAYDRSSGTLLEATALTSGVSYLVTSTNAAVDVNLLPAADVPSGPAVAHLLAVGDSVPPDLGYLAGQISTGQGSPYLRALALESFLSEHYRFATDAPSGHAYPNLRFFLFESPRAGGQRGSSEQFATAFATLGRLMGLPTRVVVGFRTPAGGGDVTAGDALAWPEVLFEGVGWVPFDPLPQADTPPRPLEDEFLPKPTPPTEPPETVEPSSETSAPSSPTAAGSATAPPDLLATGVVLGGVGGSLLVLAIGFGLVVVLLRALVRRYRLDRGPPPQRVLRAWDDVLDTLLLAGSPPPAHLSATGVAAHAATVAQARHGPRHGARLRSAVPPLEDLAVKVNAVGFGPRPEIGPTADLAAHTAKVQAVAYARAVRARRPWWRRLLWSVDPRPLRRRSGRRRG